MLDDAQNSFVDRVYEQLKAMAVQFEFKPGERLNEGQLAKSLGVSRTPLREALNRLNTEGFLSFLPGKGFFCRALDAQEIFELYELRKSIEIAGARLSIKRARETDIEALQQFLTETGPEPGSRTTSALVELDETFHERLIEMAENREMLRVLRNLNERIRFVRWIDMDRVDRLKTQGEHRAIIEAIKARNEFDCVALLEKHIDRRLDEITSAIKEGYAQIYMAGKAAAR